MAASRSCRASAEDGGEHPQGNTLLRRASAWRLSHHAAEEAVPACALGQLKGCGRRSWQATCGGAWKLFATS